MKFRCIAACILGGRHVEAGEIIESDAPHIHCFEPVDGEKHTKKPKAQAQKSKAQPEAAESAAKDTDEVPAENNTEPQA